MPRGLGRGFFFFLSDCGGGGIYVLFVATFNEAVVLFADEA